MSKLNRNIFLTFIIVGTIFMFILNYINLTKEYKNATKLIDKMSNNNDKVLLYIRDKNSTDCKLQEPQLELLGQKYGIKSYVMEVGKTTSKQFTKIINKMGINTNSISIPSIVIVEKGKAIDGLEGLNGIERVFSFLKSNNFIKEDNMPLNYIKSDEIDSLNETNSNYILALGSYRIEDSSKIESKLWTIAKDYPDLTINYLSLSEMTESQGKEFEKKFGDYFTSNNIKGTEVLIVNNGNIVDSILENKEKEDYINLFKNNEFIYGE